jgi:ribonuclease G
VPGDIKPGTLLPLIIKTLPYREKLAKASAKIPAEIEEAVTAKAEHSVKGALLYKNAGAFENSIRLVCETPGAKWVTEDKVLYERALLEASDKSRIVLHSDTDVSLCALYGLTSKLDRVLTPRVKLKSGAEIVITETEAMCVIDVNSAKALTGKDKEEVFLKLNMEAAKEIALQIGARDLSGIIMADMISMKSKESETILLEHLSALLKGLEPPARLEDITKLGIVEISRKRLNGSIASEKAFLNSTILTK